MPHPPRFLKLVDDAKTRVRETTVDEIKSRLDRGDKFIVVDVREESEFAKDQSIFKIYYSRNKPTCTFHAVCTRAQEARGETPESRRGAPPSAALKTLNLKA